MTENSISVLFVTNDSVGHVNSCIGIGQQLSGAGHKVTFMISRQWSGKLEKYGFQVIYYDINGDKINADEDPAKLWALILQEEGCFVDQPSIDKMVNIKTIHINKFCQNSRQMDPIIEDTIDIVRPDLIVLDQVIGYPSVEQSGVPWVLSCSSNPLLIIDDKRTPPYGSGYSINGDKNQWQLYRKTVSDATREIWHEFNNYFMRKGCKPLPDCQYFHLSPYLNIYHYPIELDYTDWRPLPENVYRFDSFMRNEKKDKRFELPEQLRDKPGKLIYFSLGSMGAVVVENMKRLVAIMAKSNNRFIVSKGPLHNEYDLPDNMWGQQSIPQLQVLPIVDLVITHGGNNTVTETMYFGKPMIVLPLFVDQFDNAQCVEDNGFGIRLDLHSCTENELLSAIDKLLSDKQLHEKLAKISKRIQSDNSQRKLPKIFENLLYTMSMYRII
ncbi:NDP-glycosyltransferase YjiC-like [Oppia nitens]|uniref:NDP-glycosyltransferase YjiC-like n=1 Tax=Oppia nitens TaxID=1686743 RepID=UPI0023DB7F7F|nr:NDP-glycosyltransferase YjiC-like [Oppia nitens]